LVADSSTAADLSSDQVMSRLTVAQQAELLYGAGPWHVRPPAGADLAPLMMTDGPNGARGMSFNTGLSACFPCETALAATWDPELVTEVGRAIGAEARRTGASMLLAPAVNLHRVPVGGRNFECFSEDPELTAVMTAAYVTGVQEQGVACCVKHLVGNDQETNRHSVSAEIDDATLREVYLRPFEAAVRAGAWAIMAAYNRLNGIYATESPWLLSTLLRDEWGWDGVVVSDWYATRTTAAALNAGLDLEMPGPSQLRGEKLLKAIGDGEVGEEAVERSARRVLRLLARTQPTEAVREVTSHDALIRNAGARGIVLLRNEHDILPISDQVRTIALIGPGADIGQVQGGGSCQVQPPQVRDLLTALRDRFGGEVRFARGTVDPDHPRMFERQTLHEPGALIEYRLRSDPGAAPLATETGTSLSLAWLTPVLEGYDAADLAIRIRAGFTPTETGSHQLTLAAIGSSTMRVNGSEVLAQEGRGGADVIFDLSKVRKRAAVELTAGVAAELVIDYLPLPGADFHRLQVGLIPPAPPDLLDRACELAAASDLAVVMIEHPPGVETEGHDRTGLSLPIHHNELVSRVCAANPRTVVVVNTGSPVAMPWAGSAAAIVQLWYPGQELGDSLADVLTGAVNPSGKLPVTFPARAEDTPAWPYFPGTAEVVRYGERLAIGYRGMTAEPLFPFGFGLSYSAFRLGDASVGRTATGWTVTVPVTNTSDRAGREVVQLYARLTPDRPFRELKAFGSAEIGPGQTVPVQLTVSTDSLRTWSAGGWAAPSGPVEAAIGTSSADLPITVLLEP
jgi:beta-glucosidase